MSASPMTGSCLCKRVSLTIKDPSKILDGGVEICRCTDCRQFTGALAGAFVTSPTDNVSITGENEIKNYAIKSDAGNTLTRHWCGHCGSSLYDTTSRSLGKRMTIHGVGTLPPPVAQIYMRSAEKWDKPMEGVKAYDTDPEAE